MATVFTEGRHPGEFLLSEGNFHISRDAIVIASGSGKLAEGTVLGRRSVGSAISAAKSGGNTGNGTVSAVTTVAGTKLGVYTVRFTAATVFTVEDPDGFLLATNGATGQAFSDDIGFTITAGGTPFIAGDGFDITVSAGTGKYVPSQLTGTDGSQIASAILMYAVDATSVDVPVAAITRSAEVNPNGLVYHSSIDDATKRAAKAAQLAAVGIIVRS